MADKWLREKIEKIETHISRQDVTLERLTVSVEEHVRRSNLQEEQITQTNKNLEPIKKHVAMVEGAAKLIALLALIATILEGIHAVFK